MDEIKNLEHPLLHLNLKSLTVIGMWPIRTKSTLILKLHYFYGVFIFSYFSIFLITEYMELYKVWGDLEEMTTNASVSMLYTVGFAKIYTLFKHKLKIHEMVSFISKLERSILDSTDTGAKEILLTYVNEAKRVTFFFWKLTFFTILFFFIIPMIEYAMSEESAIVLKNGTTVFMKNRPLIFSSYFPFDKKITPYYETAFLVQTIAGTIGASFLAIWDTFIVAMIIFAIGQLRVLQYKIRTVADNRSESEEPAIYATLSRCVEHHLKLINYVEDLNNMISSVMFLYCVVCSIMLCAIGFQATLYGVSLRVGFMVEYLIAMLIQLLLFYWHGNEVILECNGLSAALYECPWYERSAKFKRSLLIMMFRTYRPMVFTVGKFYTMSLETYLTIISTSYRYFAVLRQVDNRK